MSAAGTEQRFGSAVGYYSLTTQGKKFTLRHVANVATVTLAFQVNRKRMAEVLSHFLTPCNVEAMLENTKGDS